MTLNDARFARYQAINLKSISCVERLRKSELLGSHFYF